MLKQSGRVIFLNSYESILVDIVNGLTGRSVETVLNDLIWIFSFGLLRLSHGMIYTVWTIYDVTILQERKSFYLPYFNFDVFNSRKSMGLEISRSMDVQNSSNLIFIGEMTVEISYRRDNRTLLSTFERFKSSTTSNYCETLLNWSFIPQTSS